MSYARSCARRVYASSFLLAACLGVAAGAAAPDQDYETIDPAPAAPAPAHPPRPARSPLVIDDHPATLFPRMRFVLRDGSVLFGRILGFDGEMYALRLPHGTMLARKDLFTAVTPAPAAGLHQTTGRPLHAPRAASGARY